MVAVSQKHILVKLSSVGRLETSFSVTSMMMRCHLVLLFAALVASTSAEQDYIGCYHHQYNSMIFTEKLQWFGLLTPELYVNSWRLSLKKEVGFFSLQVPRPLLGVRVLRTDLGQPVRLRPVRRPPRGREQEGRLLLRHHLCRRRGWWFNSIDMARYRLEN